MGISTISTKLAPGFGSRGIEGKIEAIHYLRTRNIPFFGICLGMQMAVIEFARNVLNLPDAHSTEMNTTSPYPVIDLMEDQKEVSQKGGTMRLGSYNCELKKGTKSFTAYGKSKINERHHHRYPCQSSNTKNYRVPAPHPSAIHRGQRHSHRSQCPLAAQVRG